MTKNVPRVVSALEAAKMNTEIGGGEKGAPLVDDARLKPIDGQPTTSSSTGYHRGKQRGERGSGEAVHVRQ